MSMKFESAKIMCAIMGCSFASKKRPALKSATFIVISPLSIAIFPLFSVLVHLSSVTFHLYPTLPDQQLQPFATLPY